MFKKVCARCQEPKSVHCFPVKRGAGLEPECKVCSGKRKTEKPATSEVAGWPWKYNGKAVI